MKARAWFFVAVAAAASIAALGVMQRPAVAGPSGRLSNSLSTLRSLSQTQFEKVVYWSRHGASRPFFASTPDQNAEVQILDLNSADRDAVFAWLRGDGRQALYDRGASDADIGSRRPQTMNPSAPSPTPNPYRKLEFASASLGAGRHHIRVTSGFAAVRRDGKAVIVCVSFRNTAPQTARRVLFRFDLNGPQGRELGMLRLDRRGEFSTDVDINGWPSLSDWQSGFGNRGYGDNCVNETTGVASNPLLRAQTVTYDVVDVEY